MDFAEQHNLPDIAKLLEDLNELRKAEAYGDIEVDESQYDAEDIAREVEEYFESVSAFCK